MNKRLASIKFSIHTLLLLGPPPDDKYTNEIKPIQVNKMLDSFLAEALAVASDNLNMTACMLECAKEAAVELSPEAQQSLNRVHMGLALAMQALNHDELCQLMEQSDSYIPAWLTLT
jgi:hypothetical protein